MEKQYLFMFDLGNVVLDNIEVNKKIAHHFGLNEEEYNTEYQHYEFPLMDGTIDSSLFFRHIKHLFKVDIPHNSFATFFKPTINSAVIETIISLREEGHTVVCASNTYKEHYDIIRTMGVLELFDAHFASHEMGICKPARQFFEYMLEKTGFAPSSSFFIDDLYENIKMSRNLGIESLHFVDEKGLSALQKMEELVKGL